MIKNNNVVTFILDRNNPEDLNFLSTYGIKHILEDTGIRLLMSNVGSVMAQIEGWTEKELTKSPLPDGTEIDIKLSGNGLSYQIRRPAYEGLNASLESEEYNLA
jgi:hypothetical protein